MASKAFRWIGAAVAAIVIVAIVIAIYFATRGTATPPSPGPATARTSAPAAPAVQHPIAQARTGPAAAATTTPLPALENSDATVEQGLTQLAGAPLDKLLLSNNIVQRIVATVDALPRHELGTNILPLHPPRGAFRTQQVGGQTVISKRNYQRYAPYMRLLEHTDPKQLVDWYVAHYPLFQRAYQLQGYPHGHFNDRLIKVIDNLLATPDITTPPRLEQPHVVYTYANPKLEALSAGQKMLLRAGPANEARIKTRLRTIRDLLTGATLPAMPASTAAPASSSAPVEATSG